MKRLQPYIAPFALALIVGVMCALIYASRRDGHWWGDDWALYIRQAQGILDGNTDAVAAQNEFTVTRSAGAPFSPPIYPWGYPAVLAAFIPFLGESVDRLWIINMFAGIVVACCWYALAKVRIGRVAALVGTVAVCFTPQLMSWMDLIQSEWVFMAVVAVTMVGLDWLVRSEKLLSLTTPVWMLVVLGVGAAAGFEVRREGLAMIAAIGFAQVAAITVSWGKLRALETWDRVEAAARFLIPHLTFLVLILAIKFFMPAVLVPRYEGSGPGNVWRYRDRHVEHLADLIGFKRSYADAPTILGNSTAGWTVTIIWFALLLLGLGLSLTVLRKRNAHLAAYAVFAFIIGCSAKAALSRYFASMVPVATLLAMVALVWLIKSVVGLGRSERFARNTAFAVLTLALLPLVAANLKDMNTRVENSEKIRAAGSVQWGAQHPDAQDMFDVVIANSEPTDVIASFKARSMVLMTGRNSVQVDPYRPLADDIEVALLVAEAGDTRDDQYSADPAWREVWRNARLVVFAPDP